MGKVEEEKAEKKIAGKKFFLKKKGMSWGLPGLGIWLNSWKMEAKWSNNEVSSGVSWRDNGSLTLKKRVERKSELCLYLILRSLYIFFI